jgi:predicted ATP-dependent endonuclease of OLD family
MNNLKFKSIDITNIGGLDSLHLDFNEYVNVICGENGVGKSTILKCLVNSMDRINGSIKLKLDSKEGKVIFTYDLDKKYEIVVTDGKPDFVGDYHHVDNNFYKPGEIIFFDTEREINYKKLLSIQLDSINYRDVRNSSSSFVEGVKIEQIKDWFVMLSLHYESKNSSLNDIEKLYYVKAIQVFSELSDGEINYHKISLSNEIMLTSKACKEDLYFEYLSGGYKSCLYIVWGIIKEIQARFDKKDDIKSNLNTFDGIVVIDEIDLHLHPIWQSRIIGVLKSLLPCAQFILTTHSPCILQNLEAEEIIAIERNAETNKIRLKPLHLGRYGLQGWTYEEILTDVMGSKMLRSKKYNDTLTQFTESVKAGNQQEINENYKVLDEMLHPENPLRTIFSMQKDGIGND